MVTFYRPRIVMVIEDGEYEVWSSDGGMSERHASWLASKLKTIQSGPKYKAHHRGLFDRSPHPFGAIFANAPMFLLPLVGGRNGGVKIKSLGPPIQKNPHKVGFVIWPALEDSNL